MTTQLTKTQSFWAWAFAAYMVAIAGLTVMQILPEPLPKLATSIATGMYNFQIHFFVWSLALACLAALPVGIIAVLINLSRQG